MTTWTIYILSDGSGETAATMIRAALVPFYNRYDDAWRCVDALVSELTDVERSSAAPSAPRPHRG